MIRVTEDGWYKFVNRDGYCPSEDRTYSLPAGAGSLSEWTEPVEDQDLKDKGCHLIQGKDLTWWLNEALYLAEGQGTRLLGNPAKFAQVRLRARIPTWDTWVLRLFAVHCAERVLPLFEGYRPADSRVREALRVAQRYAYAKVAEDELLHTQSTMMDIQLELDIKQWEHQEMRQYLACSAAWLAAQAAWRCLSPVFVTMRSSAGPRTADRAWSLSKVVDCACTAQAKIALVDCPEGDQEMQIYRRTYNQARREYNAYLLQLINEDITLPGPIA